MENKIVISSEKVVEQFKKKQKKERERKRKYRLENKEKINERCRKYRLENKEKINERKRKYYQKNKNNFKKWKKRREKKDKAGVYRFFYKLNDKDFSYVGVSKHIFFRLSRHKTHIKKYYNLFLKGLNGSKTKADLERLQNIKNTFFDGGMSSNHAVYIKILMFCLKNNLHPINDLHIQVLEEIAKRNYKQSSFRMINKENKYIEKFNSEKEGFNGIWAKGYYLMRSFEKEGNLIDLKKIVDKEPNFFEFEGIKLLSNGGLLTDLQKGNCHGSGLLYLINPLKSKNYIEKAIKLVIKNHKKNEDINFWIKENKLIKAFWLYFEFPEFNKERAEIVNYFKKHKKAYWNKTE